MSLLVRTSTDAGALLVRDTDDPLALSVTESTSALALRVRESTDPLAMRVRGLFSPASLPGLAAWYDASDSGTVLTSVGPDVPATDGQTVRRWLDKSGAGRHLEQSVLASQPTLNVSGISSKPAVVGNGSQFIFTSPFAISQPFTVYHVVRYPATGNRAWSFGDTNREVRYLTGPIYELNAGTAINTTNPPAVGTNYILTHVFNGASSLFLRNATQETISPGTNGLTQYGIMARISGFGPTEAVFAEHAIYSGAHDEAQRARMRAYLASKWGITV